MTPPGPQSGGRRTGRSPLEYDFIISAELKRAPNTFKDPAMNLRFRTGFGPKAGPNEAQTVRHGTHKPAHNVSERFWPDVGVFRRRRSETFEL